MGGGGSSILIPIRGFLIMSDRSVDKSIHHQIREDIQKILSSGIDLPDKTIHRLLADKYDRSPKTVRNIMGMVRRAPEHESGHNSLQDLTESHTRRSLVLSDLHIPYHDRKALKAIYGLLSDYTFEHIILNGDFLDCYSISSFTPDPRKPLIQEEIDIATAILQKIRDLQPEAEIHFIEGNHEERLQRTLRNTPGLLGIKSLEWTSLLELDKIKASFTPYKQHITIYDMVQITHGHRVSKHSAYSAKAHLLDYGYQTLLHGHTHRLGSYYLSGVGSPRKAFEIGHLSDTSQMSYVQNPNWQQGFAIIRPPGQVEIIPIENGTFIYGDKRYG